MMYSFIIGSLFIILGNLGSSIELPTNLDRVIAEKQISLESRHDNEFVNEIFKDNILLNLRYMDGTITQRNDIKWDQVRKPFSYSFTLQPGKTFAYQDDVLDQYESNVTKTTNAHFNFQEGFKSDGYLYGDGVCHLASLIYWVAKDAGLDALAPANHNFREIPEIPKEFGVSIYSMPGQKITNARQNLYVTNDTDYPVIFVFEYDGEALRLVLKTQDYNLSI